MTNRKIKDYHRNAIVYTCIKENYKNLCRILLTLNELYPKQFYPKRVHEWLHTYADNCREMERLDEADALEYKMESWGEEYGIDDNFCRNFIIRNCPTITHPLNIKVLAHNIKLALIQTCSEFGIGDKRLSEIVEALNRPQPENPEELMEKFGMEEVEDDMNRVDYRKLSPKKQKEASYQDIKRGYEGLAKLKAYQEEVLADGKTT